MCIFCAAIPATLAVGVNLSVKQAHSQAKAQATDNALPKKKEYPIMKLSLVAAGALAIASVVYHSRLKG